MTEEEEKLDIDRRKRIERLIETEGLSQRQFAAKVGYSYSSLNKIMLGLRSVPNALPTKIVETYTDVRLDWLLYGEGEMCTRDQQLAEATAIIKHMEKLPTRPRLPKNLSEGNLEMYYGNGIKRRLCMEKPIVTQFSDYDFSLIMKNNRMSPKYDRGDEIFLKLATFPEWGNDFLLDTPDGPKFKRIYQTFVDEEREGKTVKVEYVRCVSYNREEFPDFLIERSLIHNFYRCVGVLRIL